MRARLGDTQTVLLALFSCIVIFVALTQEVSKPSDTEHAPQNLTTSDRNFLRELLNCGNR